MNYLFVYGTLLGEFKHEVLSSVSNSLKFICEATIKGALFDLGSYPGYIAADSGEVKGQLYSIENAENVFEVLDEYEGIDDENPEYVRKKIDIRLPKGKSISSWVYVYSAEILTEHKRITNGDYIAYIRNKVNNESND